MVKQADVDSYHEGKNTNLIAQRVISTFHAEVEGKDPGTGNILTEDVVPDQNAYLAVRVALDEAVTMSVEEDIGNDGTNIRSQTLNDGNSLTANAMQRFVFEARSTNGYNFKLGAGTAPTVLAMQVAEHPLGGPV